MTDRDEVEGFSRFHPRRLVQFDYSGRHVYHLVAVTAGRIPSLVGGVAADVVADLRKAADATSFDLLAFVVMPDHVHILALGASDESNAIRFMQRFKQSTGYRFKRARWEYLWQHSFFDRVIRRGEDPIVVARYIVENPIRAGLIDADGTWPYSGGTLLDGAKAPPLRSQIATGEV